MYADPNGGNHFFVEPSALSFGANGNWASAQETDLPTQGAATPANFMGPTMWTSDLSEFDGGHHGHLDMLHNSPNAMGIAWESSNTYWVFDGSHGSLSRYAFNNDHGLGGADHSDGGIQRFAEGAVARVAGVPSHLAFDQVSKNLYIADTGNRRIAVMDTASGTEIGNLPATENYDGISVFEKWSASVVTLVDGVTVGLQQPSGLHLSGSTLFVTDSATGFIWAFDVDTGETLDWLETGLPAGALMGITGDSAGALYFVDAYYHRVMKIAPKL